MTGFISQSGPSDNESNNSTSNLVNTMQGGKIPIDPYLMQTMFGAFMQSMSNFGYQVPQPNNELVGQFDVQTAQPSISPGQIQSMSVAQSSSDQAQAETCSDQSLHSSDGPAPTPLVGSEVDAAVLQLGLGHAGENNV